MKVAITGGTGFIGKHLALHCSARGDEVRILSRQPRQQWAADPVKWYKGDLSDRFSLDSFIDGVDLLYHCAGQLTDNDKMRSLHIGGTRNLIEVASQRISHWVQLSSVGVYGPVSEGVITECFPMNPIGEYEVTKAKSDNLVLEAAKRGDFSCSILRPSNVFAADMKNQSLYSMVNMIDRGFFFFIGKRGASANYVHVDNVVAALLACGSMPEAKGNIYNISDYLTLDDFVQVISGALGCRFPVVRMAESPLRWFSRIMGKISDFPLTESRIDALTNRSQYSIKRIQTALGYEHVTAMEGGLRKLVAAYKGRQ